MPEVQHPRLPDVRYTVPARAVSRWERAGWLRLPRTPDPVPVDLVKHREQ